MRLGLVSTYAPRRHELAGPARALVRELARDHEVCVCAVDRHGLEYPDEVSAVITDGRAGDYARAARILDEYGVDAVLVEYDDDVYGGSGGAYVLGLAQELRSRSVALAVRLHSLPQPGRDSGRVMAGLVEAASAVLVPSTYAAGLVVGRVAGARRVVVVPSVSLSPMARRPGAGAAGDRRTLTVLGALRPDRGLERAMVGVAKTAADHPDIRLVLAEATDDESAAESTQDERGTYVEQLWMLAHDLGMADRITIHPDRLGPTARADLLARTTVLLVPNLPADRPAFGVFADALRAGCATVATQHPYATEMLGSGAGLLLPDDEPESLAQAVGRLLGDVTRLEHARRVARAEAGRFAGPVVARRLAEVMGSLGTDDGTDDHSDDHSDAVTLRRARPTRTIEVRLDGRHHTVASRHDAARLGVVAAALAGTGAAAVGVPEWRASVEWSRHAVAVLAATAGSSPRPDGWSVRALAALSGPGLAPAVRERAAAELVGLTAGLDPADLTLDDAALAVLGLAALRLPTGLGPHAPIWSAAVARLTELGPAREPVWGPAWPWPTSHLTAEGARLPHALIVAGVANDDDQLRGVGLRALDWYLRRVGVADADGVLTMPGGESATAVGAAVEALAGAYRLTGARRFGRTALRAFAWFSGAGVTDAGPALVTVSGTLAYLGAAIALRDGGLATLAGKGTLPSPNLVWARGRSAKITRRGHLPHASSSGRCARMGHVLGKLETVAATTRPDLLASPVSLALAALAGEVAGEVQVAPIDADLADTAAFCHAYDVPLDVSANCVVVAGKREGVTRYAACLVLATTRTDVNGVVRRQLDVRKASFAPMAEAVELTGMEYGGITPIGLPEAWPVLVDPAVVAQPLVVIGSGVRRSKIVLPGAALAALPGAKVVDGLGQPVG